MLKMQILVTQIAVVNRKLPSNHCMNHIINVSNWPYLHRRTKRYGNSYDEVYVHVINNQKTNGPVTAHLISGPIISTNHTQSG